MEIILKIAIFIYLATCIFITFEVMSGAGDNWSLKSLLATILFITPGLLIIFSFVSQALVLSSSIMTMLLFF